MMIEEQGETKRSHELFEPEQKRKIFIGSLSYQIDEDVFRDYWTKFGNVVETMILRDRDGHSRGFGFVTFADSASVDAVMKSRPHKLDNRVVETKRAISREESHKPNMQLSVKKIYLGGVREPITEDDLQEYFSKYGNIVNIIVKKDRDGQHRGYGFVEFDDYDPVDRIILEKNHTIAGRTLEVQKAQMRDGQSRPRPASLAPPPSRPIVHRYYSPDPSEYQQDTNFNRSNTNWTSFGQDYQQDDFRGPIRRSTMNYNTTITRHYPPYYNRGRDEDNSGTTTGWANWV